MLQMNHNGSNSLNWLRNFNKKNIDKWNILSLGLIVRVIIKKNTCFVSLSGIDEHQAVWIVSTIGLSSIFSRIVFGYAADRPNISRYCRDIVGFTLKRIQFIKLRPYTSILKIYTYGYIVSCLVLSKPENQYSLRKIIIL